METTAALKKKADSGDIDATFRIGYRLAFGPMEGSQRNWRQIAKLWHYAALRNHPRAQFYYGTCLDHGRGVKRDLRLAHAWYLKAAKNGQLESQYNVAFHYREGSGTQKNTMASLHWFTKAACGGDIEAFRDLGYAYHEGIGTPVDFDTAVYWYTNPL